MCDIDAAGGGDQFSPHGIQRRFHRPGARRQARHGVVLSDAEGLEIHHISWGYASGPLGLCSLGWCDREIVHLAFTEADTGLPGRLAEAWPQARLRRDDRAAARLVRDIFVSNGTTGKPLTVILRATPFQMKVWRALQEIPEGRVATYGMIARAIGAPNAARAVGTACGANPVAFLIPCHRVVHGDGTISGYRWGVEKKRDLLVREFAGAHLRKLETADLT